MHRFEDKIAVVTGAGSGIGRATALRLGEEGASVVAADISAAVDDVAAEIEAAGGTAVSVRADVSRRAGAEAPIDLALERFGRLDVLCNVAGILAASHSDQTTDEEWERVIAVNLTGVFYTTRHALPALVESKGAIVMASSTSALSGHPWMTAYSASKGGVLAMTRTLAMEYARRGVRVNAVAPGGITTPMVGGLATPRRHRLLVVRPDLAARRVSRPGDGRRGNRLPRRARGRPHQRRSAPGRRGDPGVAVAPGPGRRIASKASTNSSGTAGSATRAPSP